MAKAHVSNEALRRVLRAAKGEDQFVSLEGVPLAVLVSIEKYEAMKRALAANNGVPLADRVTLDDMGIGRPAP